MTEKTETRSSAEEPLNGPTWPARTKVGHPSGWVDVSALARTCGFIVPVALGEILRMQLQRDRSDFRVRLKEILRQAYQILRLSQTEDCGFFFLPPSAQPPDYLLMTFGAAPDHQAVTLMEANEVHFTPSLDPASPEATIPALEYHHLHRPLHSAIAPTPPAGTADPDAASSARPG